MSLITNDLWEMLKVWFFPICTDAEIKRVLDVSFKHSMYLWFSEYMNYYLHG